MAQITTQQNKMTNAQELINESNDYEISSSQASEDLSNCLIRQRIKEGKVKYFEMEGRWNQ